MSRRHDLLCSVISTCANDEPHSSKALVSILLRALDMSGLVGVSDDDNDNVRVRVAAAARTRTGLTKLVTPF